MVRLTVLAFVWCLAEIELKLHVKIFWVVVYIESKFGVVRGLKEG